MARVLFTGNFRHLVGDDAEAEIPATNVRDLLTQLGERYPALAPHLDEKNSRQKHINEENKNNQKCPLKEKSKKPP